MVGNPVADCAQCCVRTVVHSAPRMASEQLSLPKLDSGSSDASLYRLPHDRRVWVNRSLRMDQVEWVGFDMDYTLAIYRQTEIDRLSIEATVRKLIERGYPRELADVPFAYDFPVRGLLIDKRYGHLLKMDRYKYVGKGYHGMRPLTREERRGLYHSRRVRPVAPRYHWIDTLYALPEAALYAGAVDLLDRTGTPVDYARLFEDIRECIDAAHRDGAIVDVIRSELDRFVERDPELPTTLHKLRSAGKKLFLLTNSQWAYTDAMMTYLLGDTLAEYPSWRHFFDAVVVAASKPAFFQERRPFAERIGSELIATTRLERGKIYEGGNIRDFERMIRTGGDSVLYVGDHIYGDILRSKKESAWRTMMIVQEMAAESAAMGRIQREVERLDGVARQRDRLEDELRFRQARLKAVLRAMADRGIPLPPNGAATESIPPGGPDADRPETAGDAMSQALRSASLQELEAQRLHEKRGIERIRAALREIDEQGRRLGHDVDQAFHPYWGSIFKLGVELSSFGDQVETYACLYTTRVSNLHLYSPLHFFRSPRDLMPHELP